LNIIEIIGGIRDKSEEVVEKLKLLQDDDSVEVATVACKALNKSGINTNKNEEKSVIRELIWTWQHSGLGIDKRKLLRLS